MAVNNNNNDFLSMIGQSNRQIAPDDKGDSELSFNSFFDSPKSDTYRKNKDTDEDSIPGASKYRFIPHYKGFVVYRRWDKCPRCRDAIANCTAVLPDVGDLECPHTQVREYLAVKQDMLDGKGHCDAPKETTLEDGSVVITLAWYSWNKLGT